MKNKCENCGECCLKTEMILSEKDIIKIIRKSLNRVQKEEFIYRNKDGFFQLKNIDDHCIFFNLDVKQCKIYEFRPQGCRFYPLIFDFQEKNCFIDKDCPRSHLFYQDKNELKKTCKNLSKFIDTELKLKII